VIIQCISTYSCARLDGFEMALDIRIAVIQIWTRANIQFFAHSHTHLRAHTRTHIYCAITLNYFVVIHCLKAYLTLINNLQDHNIII